MSLRANPLALVLVLAIAPRLLAGVVVVGLNTGPGLQAAIDGAAAGDILILVGPDAGVISSIQISGKGLTLAAWPAGSTTRMNSLRITDATAS